MQYRISEIYGCVVLSKDTLILLSKKNIMSVPAELSHNEGFFDFMDVFVSAFRKEMIIPERYVQEGIMTENDWKIISDNYDKIQHIMVLLRRFGVSADSLYPGKYISENAVSAPLCIEEADKDKELHIRFGIRLRRKKRSNQSVTH